MLGIGIRPVVAWLLGLTLPAQASVQCSSLGSASRNPYFCSSVWAKGLAAPRGLVVTRGGEVLVLDYHEDTDSGKVIALWDAGETGYAGYKERAVVLEAQGLNHGASRGRLQCSCHSC